MNFHAPTGRYNSLFLFLLFLLAVRLTDGLEETTEAAKEPVTKDEEEEDEIVVATIDVSLAGKDKERQCADWAETGECSANPDYMANNCAASCNQSKIVKALVYQGEDAAVAAFRFAEETAVTDTQIVLDVAQSLRDALGDYNPPTELTKCGKRSCSAGKLWKRAEEMRNANAYDAAGADLIRALLKTGIEVDFIQRCKQSLQWAFASVKKQREREEREAMEEAKLEQRREEERIAMEQAKVSIFHSLNDQVSDNVTVSYLL